MAEGGRYAYNPERKRIAMRGRYASNPKPKKKQEEQLHYFNMLGTIVERMPKTRRIARELCKAYFASKERLIVLKIYVTRKYVENLKQRIHSKADMKEMAAWFFHKLL